MAAGMRGNADEIGPYGGIISLRPMYVHPNGDYADNHGAKDNGQPNALPDDLAVGFDLRIACISHKSTPEKEQPGTQSDQNPKRKIHQGQNAEVSFDFRPDKDSAEQKDSDNPDGDTEHPSRKE
jgi:hypothetical protein